jgi:uncharacterized protein YPO0396
LRGFGLSLLVPESDYAAVVEWVDRNHLGGRLVYFRVRALRRGERMSLHPDSIIRKLLVQPGSPFYDWMERELAQRFDVACCTAPDQFKREVRAMTRTGQLKMPGERHEKDDRHRLDDRSRFILGWSNEAKIAALEGEKLRSDQQRQAVEIRYARAQLSRDKARARLEILSKLEEYVEYRELDWASVASHIAALEQERHQLERASNVLAQLTANLKQLGMDIGAAERRRSDEIKRTGILGDRLAAAQGQEQAAREVLERVDQKELENRTGALDGLRTEALGEASAVSLDTCEAREREMREWIQSQIDGKDRSLATLRDRLIRLMGDFCREFEAETREIDPSLESAGEFRRLLEELTGDDLPRFESRFKELLNQNTIREIANFNAHLNQQRETIRERVARINQSLVEIDYNPGRYVVLEATPSPDQDLRSFQNELRACTEGAFTGSEDDQYSEAKFLQVRGIIERFRGREGSADTDLRWTRKVTDVRTWFVFAASERWRADHCEHEHYSDSGGKSGGQKEKLAYTVLAASLAYQFGLEWGRVKSRSFRFVVIDEAFGRGSDESAQYGLRLFEKLNLQLLIVTPLQKIHVIEPHVASVGFVHNAGGADSQLRNLSIEDYRAEKARTGK